MVTCYLAMRNALLVVSDGSDGPTVDTRLTSHTLDSLAVDAEAPNRVFVGTTESGLLRSVDGGATFDREIGV